MRISMRINETIKEKLWKTLWRWDINCRTSHIQNTMICSPEMGLILDALQSKDLITEEDYLPTHPAEETFGWKTVTDNLLLVEGDVLTYNGRRGGLVQGYEEFVPMLIYCPIIEYQTTQPWRRWWETIEQAAERMCRQPWSTIMDLNPGQMYRLGLPTTALEPIEKAIEKHRKWEEVY